MGQQKSSPFTRRHFLSCVALGTAGLLTKDLLYPARAMAASEGFDNDLSKLEKYHIFVPYTTARNGGKQSFILRSGETCQTTIPKSAQENQEVTVKEAGQEGNDIIVIIHTLYDRQTRIADQIYQEIEKTQFIESSSQVKCKTVYEQVEDAEYIDDLISLDLLDYVIASSKLADDIKQRYELASTNSRLLGIQNAIETALEKSSLAEADQQKLRGTFAYVRAGEPVPDFKALTDLETIITNSELPQEIKQTYSLANATSRALTVDFILVKLINESQQLLPEDKETYLSVYQQVRDGKTVTDESVLKTLDSLVDKANIPANAKVVYSLTRKQDLDAQENFAQQVDTLLQEADQFEKQLKDSEKRGAAIVPHATKLLSTAGAETATGVSISSLSGAAATNATLAFLGGGSVASGGLGMLGGLAVVTGGAALIGAAGLVSIALVSQMDREDLTNLGVAIGTGTVAGAATVLAAWTAAGALGVTGTLSGAAAISTTIATLGGLSVMTGGAALVASGTAFLIWSLLEGSKKRDHEVLQQLETRAYTLTEDPIPGSIAEFLRTKVREHYGGSEEGYSAPNIPLDKLSNALSSWLSVEPSEKIVALIDTSTWDDAKKGVSLTDKRLIWKATMSETRSIPYEKLSPFFNMNLSELVSDQKHRQDLYQLEELVKLLENDTDRDDWVKLLKDIGEKYSSV